MGLNINTVSYHGHNLKDYERYGSYGRIHILRSWVRDNLDSKVKVKGLGISGMYEEIEITGTDFDALINHDDSEGGYLDFKELGVEKTSNMQEWNDLNKLFDELKIINKSISTMPENVAECYRDLAEIVGLESEEKPTFVMFC